MKRYSVEIRIWGIVQGVGFRPFLAKLAQRMGIKGEVRNSGGMVELRVTACEKEIEDFIAAIKSEKPPQSVIVKLTKRRLENTTDFTEFSIMESNSDIGSIPMIAPDIAICPDCLREMRTPSDRRYRHPFISCMSCGPRYTIMKRLPYDRANTSMESYKLCEDCGKEYLDIKDRRYHAETISCHACGPLVRFKPFGAHTDDELEGLSSAERTEKAIALMKEALSEGGILGFKSVGGYNLVCDPKDKAACDKLRSIKGREAKPFALMFSSAEELRGFCELSELERELLESAARPIVLLKRLKGSPSEGSPTLYDGGRHSLGAFLPSLGLQYLLLEAYGVPLIFTSMNSTSLPIIYEDSEAFAFMERAKGLISGIVWNDREIVRSADDSVLRVIDGRAQMIRRSKGYAPLPLELSEGGDREGRPSVFACGGFLKSSFVLSKDGFYYPSRHFGDLDSDENMRRYERAVTEACSLFDIEPEVVACDPHPDYPSTDFAEGYASQGKLELLKIQHHHAHIASVMAEHGLRGPLIGVALDGTGYGTDGKIWGGELLLCEGKDFRRVSHLPYVRMMGGDSSVSSAWKSAFSYMYAYGYLGKDIASRSEYRESAFAASERSALTSCMEDLIEYALENNTLRGYEDEKDLVLRALEAGINCRESSSMGRLFDAASALLGICCENTYEGEAASALEAAALDYLDGCEEKSKRLAYELHLAVVSWLGSECEKIRREQGGRIDEVALSGGCFQNGLLLEKSLESLRSAGFKLYYNGELPPNDGGIALGQAYLAEMER